jgi:hypothetical protein
MGRGNAHIALQGSTADYPDPDGMLGTLAEAAFDDREARGPLHPAPFDELVVTRRS